MIAWLLDDAAGTLVPFVLGVEDVTAHRLAAGTYVAMHDDRGEAEQAWRYAVLALPPQTPRIFDDCGIWNVGKAAAIGIPSPTSSCPRERSSTAP